MHVLGADGWPTAHVDFLNNQFVSLHEDPSWEAVTVAADGVEDVRRGTLWFDSNRTLANPW